MCHFMTWAGSMLRRLGLVDGVRIRRPRNLCFSLAAQEGAPHLVRRSCCGDRVPSLTAPVKDEVGSTTSFILQVRQGRALVYGRLAQAPHLRSVRTEVQFTTVPQARLGDGSDLVGCNFKSDLAFEGSTPSCERLHSSRALVLALV